MTKIIMTITAVLMALGTVAAQDYGTFRPAYNGGWRYYDSHGNSGTFRPRGDDGSGTFQDNHGTYGTFRPDGSGGYIYHDSNGNYIHFRQQ